MSHYFISTASGILALVGIAFLMNEECRKRHAAYEKQLHTQLLLCDVPGSAGPLVCQLYRTSTVLGRRRRRSDICLACYDDLRISRNHALLTYDGENFRIKPVFRLKDFRHTEIIVEHQLVPPEGMVINYGDRIGIAGHIMVLQNSNDLAKDDRL